MFEELKKQEDLRGTSKAFEQRAQVTDFLPFLGIQRLSEEDRGFDS
jgi:hypothetical protein